MESLKQALTKLNFDVRDYSDLRKRRIVSLLKRSTSNYYIKAIQNKKNVNAFMLIFLVAKENHEHNDCLMVVVMSHGETNHIYASDGKYPSEFLWSPFLGTNCKSLIGKPKLFFIQACRGTKVDSGVVMSRNQRGNNTQIDSPESDKPIHFFMPAMADLLMMYSTYEGKK